MIQGLAHNTGIPYLLKVGMVHNATKNKRKEGSSMKKSRTCFNYGDSEHFVAECPFKTRIENGGRLIKKNNFAPKTKRFIKKVAPRALITNEGEYIYGGEESEDDEEQVGMAFVAIGVTSSSQGSLFTNPNEKTSPIKHKCFMAKGVPPKVTSTPKIVISSTPSMLEIGRASCRERVCLYV